MPEKYYNVSICICVFSFFAIGSFLLSDWQIYCIDNLPLRVFEMCKYSRCLLNKVVMFSKWKILNYYFSSWFGFVPKINNANQSIVMFVYILNLPNKMQVPNSYNHIWSHTLSFVCRDDKNRFEYKSSQRAMSP